MWAKMIDDSVGLKSTGGAFESAMLLQENNVNGLASHKNEGRRCAWKMYLFPHCLFVCSMCLRFITYFQVSVKAADLLLNRYRSKT